MKYFDDATIAVSVDLKSLQSESNKRPKPLNFNEQSELLLLENRNELQKKMNEFEQFTDNNHMKINQNKSKVMLFNFSQKYRFPLEVNFSDGKNLEVLESAKSNCIQFPEMGRKYRIDNI